MELKERILKILTTERLSASAFADRIGVQRSTISHIISGRNKPSLEFIQKIIPKFPNISIEWILLGVGDMHTQTNLNTSPITNTNVKLGELPLETGAIGVESSPKHPIIDPELAISKEESQQTNPLSTIEPNNVLEGKTVEQVIICYSDKTFLSYKPE